MRTLYGPSKEGPFFGFLSNKKPRLLPGGSKRGEHTMRTLIDITTTVWKRFSVK